MTEIHYDALYVKDISSLAELDNLCFPNQDTEPKYWLEKPCLCFVASDRNKVVGLTYCWDKTSVTELLVEVQIERLVAGIIVDVNTIPLR